MLHSLFKALVLLLVTFTSSGTAVSQSKLTELDTLFAKLRTPDIGSEVLRVEVQIWDHWMHAGTDTENEQLAKATAAMNIGDFKSAEKQLEVIIARAPQYSEAWNKRATLMFLMGQYERSLADIAKTLELEPRHFGALSGRGMIYQRQGKNAEALAAFKDALNIHPHMVGARLAVQQLEQLLPEL